MRLLEAIDRALEAPIDTKRLRSLRGIVAEFLGADTDADLLVTLTPGWAERFAAYLSTYPNRLKNASSPYLSLSNQRLYLGALRSLLRKAAAAGAYPDIDPIQPLLDAGADSAPRPKRPSASPVDLHEQLRRLCALRLEGEEAALRSLYYFCLAAGGLEFTDLPSLKEDPTAPHPTLLLGPTPLSHSESLLSLLKEQRTKNVLKEQRTKNKEQPVAVAQGKEPVASGRVPCAAVLQPCPSPAAAQGKEPVAVAQGKEPVASGRVPCAAVLQPCPSPSRLRRFFAERKIALYQGGSIFADLLSLALPAVGASEVAKAAETRLLHPDTYYKNITRYQALLSAAVSDSGMLAQRWYALRSLSPRRSGADIAAALSEAPEEISTLVSDTYAPADLIVVERDGMRTTRNHPAVRSLLFVKTLRPSIPRILKHVGDTAAYKRTANASDGYSPVPYREIYRMKLVLGAVGSDPSTEIYTNEELRSHFALDDLAVGDHVTVARPGYEQFTARIIRRKAGDLYCVTFPDFGFNVVMNDIPRALLQEQRTKNKEQTGR